MSRDDLDRILASDRGITPSAAFASRVMTGVQREAALPPPIAFPWRRVRLILVACGAALAAAFVLFAILVARADMPLGALERLASVRVAGALGSGVLPVLITALGGSWLLVRLTLRRVVGPR